MIRNDLKTFAHAFYEFSTEEIADGCEDEDVVKIKLPENAANIPHPFLAALQDAWPVVEVIAQNYGKNEKMIDVSVYSNLKKQKQLLYAYLRT